MDNVRRLKQDLNMGNIDEISEALGSIKSSITNLVDGHKETRDTLAVINDKLSAHGNNRTLDKSAIDAAHSRLDKIEPLVQSHDKRFQFMVWLATGVATLVTFFSDMLVSFIGKLFH